MLASLIPFFLVVRLPVDEGVWKYGPEYVFDVEMNTTLSPMNSHKTSQGVTVSNYTVMNLFCRPKGSDELNCHLGNARRQSVDVTNDNKLDVPEEEMKTLYSGDHFEMKFDEDGVEHLIVDERTRVDELNQIKSIAELLNIGANLNGLPDGTFHVLEDSTIGQCNVTFRISHHPSKGAANKMTSHRYELESLPQLNKVPGEAIVIQKTVNLSNCSHYAPFYFGTYGDVVVEPSLHSHLESSSSRIFVSDVQLASLLARVGTMGSDKTTSLMSQFIKLGLRDIRAAKQEIDDVSMPSKTTILANSELNPILARK